MDSAQSTEGTITDLTKGVYRRLYSGYIKGQRINKLSLGAETWFWRVLATVDDFGNGDADPELCWAATVGRRPGITSKEVAGWLLEMQTVGLIEFYEVKGEPFLHVVGFETTQPAGKNGRRVRRFEPPDESREIQRIPDVVSASYSDSDSHSDSDSDFELVGSRAKPRSPRTVKLCDDEYLLELQAREPYRNLNVRNVYGKMVTWCENKGKQPTRSRLINWLNREDQPMNGNGNLKQNTGVPPGSDFEFQPKSITR